MRAISLAAFTVVLVAVASTAAAATADHLKCYKIKDPVAIAAVVDLNSVQFGLESGCKVSKAVQFCVPVTKSVTSLLVDHLSTTPLPIYGGPPLNEDRICYKLRCPTPAVPIADQVVTDQFDSRTISRFKAAMVCTPAVKGASYCGDGVIDAGLGEDCDGAGALGSCTAGCQSDCTCACETACCYVEDVATPPETQCFQYTGMPTQVAAFGTACSVGGVGVPGSIPAGTMWNSVLGGPCGPNPVFGGFPGCSLGPPGVGNLHVLPTDSSCP
ncbi:MAG: hypothetical protein HY899_15355 [Deltaproteobacteria bacterium]|nr:hypothetical protein [Deltaproteobacteria bacterium]